MFVCTYVRVCMCVCGMCVCAYGRMFVCAYVRMYVCNYVRMFVCTYVRMYVCTYVCTYVRMYVRMHPCMYVCMYVCTLPLLHTQEWLANFSTAEAWRLSPWRHRVPIALTRTLGLSQTPPPTAPCVLTSRIWLEDLHRSTFGAIIEPSSNKEAATRCSTHFDHNKNECAGWVHAFW